MTMTLDAGTETTQHGTKQIAARDGEPWVIWAALMVFLNVLVISGMIYGLAGFVAVMVPAAFAMVLVLLRIVTEGM